MEEAHAQLFFYNDPTKVNQTSATSTSARSTSIRIPKVYHAWGEYGGYIVMEYIDILITSRRTSRERKRLLS
ncbi:hypothetical protein AJ79_02914 [Helicocarpus griseus UAMH5409]|uniref:Uncharacterized protein n=1 Tax=Helicocarpus griseus UAMH5409 TaxID=1447875 RepID=A0A2B7Y087_9EURO|nr:hypothetical protein AJ79_02914 [Helicocarpus griseus UAMH5409]